MPSCVRCNEFFPRETVPSECPICGGEVLSGQALIEARAAARNLSPEDYLAEREIERQSERQARREAEAAEYQAEEARAAAELEARAAAAGLTTEELEADWVRRTGADPAGMVQAALVVSLLAPVVTGLTGVILTVVFIVIGRSPWAAICGTVLGGVSGLILSLGLLWGAIAIADSSHRVPGMIRGGAQRLVASMGNAERIGTVTLLSPLVLPPAMVVVVSLLLPPISAALVAITVGVAVASVGTAWLGWRWFRNDAK
jgi:hypothetical protein